MKNTEFKVEDCRMYENEFPNVNDLVMCKVSEIFDEGAYVELLEYNHMKAMILKSELSKNRIQTVKQITREGNDEVLVVARIDKEQGYIDLSKKDVKTDDNKKFQDLYAKSKQVHNIMKSVANKIGLNKIIDLYKKFGWDLYKQYGHAHDAFGEVLNNPDSVLGKYNLDEDLKKAIIDVVNLKMTPHSVKIKAEVKITCFTVEGISDIKDALNESLKENKNSNIVVNIRLIASPTYEVYTETVKKTEGLQAINTVVKAIENCIKNRKGNFILSSKPEICGDNNTKDADLMQMQIIKMNKENQIEDNNEEDEDHEEGIKANIEGIDDNIIDN